MIKIVQLNSFDSGSTGNIAKQINLKAEEQGYKTYFFFGRFWKKKHELPLTQIKIANQFDCLLHVIESRLFDSIGLGSSFSTKQLINYLEEIQPNIVHLHNIHGYYINYPMLFKYLKIKNINVVWTLHDCWAITGHCSHFDLIGCDRWKNICHNCPQKKEYPKSFFAEKSKRNFNLKKKYFTSLGNKLTIVPVSNWLANILKDSFLKETKTYTIHNGIDLTNFKPLINNDLIQKYNLHGKNIILGVASPWTNRKGFNDFIKLREKLSDKYAIIMVGLSSTQIKNLPLGIIGLERTQNVQELTELYSISNVFVNTSYEDNYPTVNLESIACGTPVITYRTGGSPEAITKETGRIIKQGNMEELVDAIYELEKKDRNLIRKSCRVYAEQNFNKEQCYQKYIELYNNILNN